ncbi:hypothetical protein FQN52_009389 [Onygenales sp. PD_12]|nr:hypothetical protein FQN52_009389 [Onygenales sp. PD_12]
MEDKDHAAGPASEPEQTSNTEGKLETLTDESISDPIIDALQKKYSVPLDNFRSLPPLPIPYRTSGPLTPIKTIWYEPDTFKALETGVAGPEWTYHRPQVKYPGRGIPNYIPEWELIQEGENWYHIDDANRSCPVTFSDANLNYSVVHYIPYSFMPRAPIAIQGILDYPREKLNLRQLQTSLGCLYSVPSDNRFYLSFEKTALRLKMAEGTADRFFEKIRALFDSWGTFQVVDFDDHMRAILYGTHDLSDSSWWKDTTIVEQHPYWSASGPAMMAERDDLNIPPTPLVVLGRTLGARIYLPQCPWYRIVECHGLESALALQVSREFAEPENIVDMLFDFKGCQYPEPVIMDGSVETRKYLTNIFKLHLSCHHRYSIGNRYLSVGFWQEPFHLTWFRIMEEEPGQTGTWKSGKLYGDKSGRKIQEVAFTLDYIYQAPHTAGSADHTYHWTVLLLSAKHMRINTSFFSWAPSVILYLISDALCDVSDSWEEIASHFAYVLNDQDAIFDPQMHDSLLFDDDTFSRSRLYFWAIDSLELFKDQIAHAIKEWGFFWEARCKVFKAHEEILISRRKSAGFDDPFYWAKKRSGYRVEDVAKEIEIQVNRLRDLEARFDRFYRRAQSLRDGLFNASSVVESRAATQLGENVRLLTYVSIVYLPLGFSAALWSINEEYSVPNFAMVTVVIGLTTYILVSNLNNAVRFSKRTFRQVKTPVVDRMKNDPDKIWSDRAARFTAFRPEREKVEPSLWYIPQYMFIETLRKFGLSKRPPGGLAEEPKQKPSKSGNPSNNPPAAKEASEKTTKQPAKNDTKPENNQTSEPHKSNPPDNENPNSESNDEGTKTLRFLSRPAYYWMKLKRRRGPAQQDGAEREV